MKSQHDLEEEVKISEVIASLDNDFMLAFNKRAVWLYAEFLKLRDQLVEFAKTPEGSQMIDDVDRSARRKLLQHISDITPFRLVAVSKKILKARKMKGG